MPHVSSPWAWKRTPHAPPVSVSPLPVNVTLNGAPVGDGANLLRPMIKVWGSKTSELDGTPASTELDGSEVSEANYISKYLPLSPAYGGETLSFPFSNELQDGFYNISATVSWELFHAC